MTDKFFDPAERARMKQASRDQDEADLKAGRVTAAELQRRNGFIPSEMARKARISEWGEFEPGENLPGVGRQAIAGNPLTKSEIGMFEMFEREGWSHERRRAYILARIRDGDEG